ncbi:Flp pilus assembly protein CpaB [Novosphingobium aerophilum]|uniref:Flp pilus assembly protein CpaB n=1 Tax=Novosphingobium TaxID=165696 RepID=UPI0006C88E10|nr:MULTISPECIES: Flp pilus assembly protein CpaB [unclassified Novosphingobium]KPH59570.1 pilus assembly protein CpaB [Novosphingobium sp. ST904]MPS69163.1 Flp pilus assembly protein CpaB [Novosphingobium sp.]TCM38017.1 pilus assembly protein CpaB [Novosphingobium sp. ST904]WRT92295.1 Flp pilus assembly protein CpaB [Novosphingobium sp. RL4]
MDRKKLVLLATALLIAVVTAMAARSMFAGAAAPQAEAAQQAQPTGPKVLVAQRALPVGTIITADAVSYQDWPKELVKDAYFIDGESDMQKLLGTVVRFQITAGQPVTQGALVAPGDRGFLAAALGPGMRAVTIPVSAKTGVGGFVFPGDHVDLVLTQEVRGSDGGDALRASETILRNLRVLATDQATDNEVVDGKTVVHAFSTVTLEVTPRIAEKVAVAQEIGTLSLSLRAIADNQGEFERILASGDIKVPEGATREQEEKIMKQAMERPLEGISTYMTGGDVSRFQRSSRPATSTEVAARTVTVASAPQGPSSAAPVRTGPVVRVTRGKETVEVPVSSR